MAKAIKEKLITPEEKRENDLQSFLSDGYGSYKPEPAYEFRIGDAVRLGSLQDVMVCGKMDNGIYEVDYSTTNNNYGNPIRTEHQRRFVHWYDLRPVISQQPASLIKNDDLRLSYSQQSLEGGILRRVYYFGVDFTPAYQRDYVWELSDKVALIDSIFQSVDIGKFVFIHNEFGENEDCYTVLDGKQRTKALLDFYENRFQYKGLYFNELSYRDQDFFENYSVSVAEVKNINEKQILRYFLKLNRCGKIMDEKHLKLVESMLL